MAHGKQFQISTVTVSLLLCSVSSDDVYDSEFCSPDNEKCKDTYVRQTKQEIPEDTKAIMDAVAAVQLYKAQKEVANYLELAYITLSDHPDQATEVRMTAHAARTQHMMTSGLMKTFMVTAAHIVNTIIPMFFDAIELKDPDIVKDLFDKIIIIADNMKTEAEETKARYRDIHLKVQENLASINKRNRHVVERGEELQLEKEREEQEAQAAKHEEKELVKLQEQMDEEIKDLRENRNMWREEAAHAGRSTDEDDFTMFDIPFGAAKAFTSGGWPGIAFGILQAGGSIFKKFYRSYKQETKYEHFMDAYKESQENLDLKIGKRSEIHEKRTQKHMEALRRLSKIKQIIQEEVGLGDAESLREASIYLGRVDGLFNEIIRYWGHMANVIKVIREESNVGDVYLKKMENPAYAARLKKQLEKEENHWKFFGRICKDYTIQTDTEIKNLYKFLTAPVDTLAANEKKQRQQKLFHEIEAEINGEFVDDDY
ncbi:uncharacterized protein LOC123546464 [Mercenaria mercenaria]|uniref:uncharacterized protein LOC123546464 n=1 Tax=Mercenaria mercenaria TaxID=6596 RepID=UPI00234EA880|nr:uncharacterized protein LOC123546464 [Mercenaria mercenaria]